MYQLRKEILRPLCKTGPSQADLGRLIGVSRVAVNNWVKGKNDLTYLHKMQILVVLENWFGRELYFEEVFIEK